MNQTHTGEVLQALLGLRASQFAFATQAEAGKMVRTYQETIYTSATSAFETRIMGLYCERLGLRTDKQQGVLSLLCSGRTSRYRHQARPVDQRSLGQQVLGVVGNSIGLSASTLVLIRQANYTDNVLTQQRVLAVPLSCLIEQQAAELVGRLAA